MRGEMTVISGKGGGTLTREQIPPEQFGSAKGRDLHGFRERGAFAKKNTLSSGEGREGGRLF